MDWQIILMVVLFFGLSLIILPFWIVFTIKGYQEGIWQATLSLLPFAGFVGLGFQLGKEKGQKKVLRKALFLLFGKSVIQIPIGVSESEKITKPVDKIKPTKTFSEKKQRVLFWGNFLKENNFLLKNTFKDFFRFVFFQKMDGFFQFGFNDPALTGEVWGFLGILKQHQPKRINFFGQPTFWGPFFKGQLTGKAWLFPLGILGVVVMRGLMIGFNYLKFRETPGFLTIRS